MGRGPSVLLLDDGELDDIQAILDALGAAYARVRGSAIVKGTPPPQQLLVSTPRRIASVGELEPSDDDDDAPVKIVVVQEDSNSLRNQLRRFGFDYLVRRPVHPEALRLLLMRSLYRGDERRKEPRVAVGLDVSFRTGLLSRRALLADLSIRGCRLLSRQSIDQGKRIRVSIPEALETGTPISVTGRVLRVDRRKGAGHDLPYSAAVLFDAPSADAHEAIELLIEDLARGPATLRRGVTPTSDVDPQPRRVEGPQADEAAGAEDDHGRSAAGDATETAAQAASERSAATRGAAAMAGPASGAIEVDVRLEVAAEDEVPAKQRDARTSPDAEGADAGQGARGAGDRRGKRRAAYRSTVPAFGKRALRVLVGRDLSMGGMRIEPLPGLELGDRLHLAIYGEAGESPFLVWSTVVRDDGEVGMALRFDALPAETGARLERLVGALPSVESLHDSETDAMGTVMTEILAR